MNRRLFASRIAEKTDHPAAAIDTILEAALAVLAGELAKEGRFEWRGFGTFTVRAYPARKIHNPRTCQVMRFGLRLTPGQDPWADNLVAGAQDPRTIAIADNGFFSSRRVLSRLGSPSGAEALSQAPGQIDPSFPPHGGPLP